ncbi:phage virion morphogenesis protein [Burkholderia sp. Bp9140]|uniref:phage virion morphogenesis protein n=1 Tax=Burkholderia sp. Bp9140 TaxID=2184572 RepID=UPI000F5729D8|nr:phage virion morphogenesis protein [Burkholderia sp. Bp9140]RQR50463.1 phage virion morphogenesis protein [Burkholderia sp. Bp9140]
MAELTALEKWASGLLAKLSPAQRMRVARDIAGELRRAQQSRIVAQQNPDGSQFEPRKAKAGGKRLRDKKGRVKRAAMFRKLRTARYLRIEANPAGLAVGFDGRLAGIVRVHQEGRTAPVEPGGPMAKYPVRMVLGFAKHDRDLVRDRLLRHLTD